MRTIHYLTNPRSFFALLHDVIIAILAWVFAYYLRFNFDVTSEFMISMWRNLIWILPLQLLTFLGFGLYQGVWRFASIPDLKRILKATAVASLIVTSVLLMIKPFGVVPRSVLILDPILLVLGMCGSRFAYRAWKEHKLYSGAVALGKPVLILGAGEAAISLVKDLSRSKDWQVVGLLDDNLGMRDRELMGVKVLGSIADLPKVVSVRQVEHVIIAMPSATHQSRKNAVDVANQAGLSVLTVPAFDDLMSGKVSISQIRKVDVEDLLGRDAVNLDNTGLQKLIEGKTILVTGAAGSIGSELCRQITKYNPTKLICYDISEYALYQLEQEFARLHTSVKFHYLVGDVKNKMRIEKVISQFKPNVVFHAAAYKHVPLMEHENVIEALSNNVIGTHTVALACQTLSVPKFVLISTDKAVNPTNVMGASKRLAELVCQSLSLQSATKFITVRFGNVLGSSGSVIPKFRQQIAKGGPVTVTHPEITRYFMSIPEAAQLVMQAGLMGEGGEIFVLDMGQSVKIADLARDMIRLSGLQLDEIEIQFTGLRPGEKLYEELLADDEQTLPTPHEKLRVALARTADKQWLKGLLVWLDKLEAQNEALIKAQLKDWVIEYTGEIHHDAFVTIAPTLTSSTLH